MQYANTHKLQDGAALGAFLTEWAAAAGEGSNGDSSIAAAEDLMVAATLFPADDLSVRDSAKITAMSWCRMGNCATKRFLFGGQAIGALVARGMGPSADNPIRVEAVSRFLRKCAMAESEGKSNGLRRGPSTFTHLVNVRRRMSPPLWESSIGSLLCLAVAQSESNGSHRADDMLPSLVGELRGAISKVDGEFLLGLSRDRTLITGALQKISGVG